MTSIKITKLNITPQKAVSHSGKFKKFCCPLGWLIECMWNHF